jgi:hypothetical protein
MPKKSTPTKRKDVAEQPTSGGRRPSACSLLGDVIEAPGPYDVVRAHNSELWLVVDAHRDAILWTEQQLAADAAAEALNGMARLKALHDCMDPQGFFARKIEKILSPENDQAHLRAQ